LGRDIKPILVLIPIVIVSLASIGALIVSDPAKSSDEPAFNKLSLKTIYPVKPISVDNAGWQLALHVENHGNRQYFIDKVYINGMLIEELGVIHGDSLSSNTTIGTSIPVNGLVLPPNRWMTVYIWVGSNLYTKGIRLTVELQEPGQLELREIIVLR
jgi:hypothetical protein